MLCLVCVVLHCTELFTSMGTKRLQLVHSLQVMGAGVYNACETLHVYLKFTCCSVVGECLGPRA